jgi:hypothetical protein
LKAVDGFVIAAKHFSHPETLYWCGESSTNMLPDLQAAIRFVSAAQAATVLNKLIEREFRLWGKIVPFVAVPPASSQA